MSAQKTLALTLRTLDFSETSQIVTVYTRDAGRMTLLAKGSRRKNRGIQGGIDLFQLLEIVYIERPGAQLGLLTEFTLKEEFAGLRRSLARGYAAFFVAELMRTLTEEHDPAPEVFDLALETLTLLGETGRVETATHAFEARFLRLIGLLPRFDACASCGRGIDGKGDVAFAPGAGGALCGACAPGVAERISVSRGALAMLSRLAATSSNKVERLRISGTIADDVRRMLARVWLNILGREPEMIKHLRWTPRSAP